MSVLLSILARDCIIPDISRTYHFGEDGENVKTSMQLKYFTKHALYKVNDFTSFPPIQYFTKNTYDEGKSDPF